MKKIIVSLALLFTAGVPTVLAHPVKDPDPLVLDAFKKEFSGAHDVKWAKEEGFDKAIFGLLGHRVIAYFNEKAELEGCIRDLFFDQLPLVVMTAVDKRFPAAVILSVREIANTSGTSYQLILESKEKKYNVKLGADGSIRETEKIYR